jgi:4-phospho-D-threonate 3-dehydrogenase / 4-phospho-D-erythronate 3-dehydrogenase
MRIGITCGDPAGIGGEVILKSLARVYDPSSSLLLFGSRRSLEESELVLCANPNYERWVRRFEATANPKEGQVGLVDVGTPLAMDFAFGRHDPANATIQWRSFQLALDALDQGSLDAVVTGPWNKGLLTTIGMTPVGHTEILAERYRAPHHVMMLAGPTLRVSLVTTHLPIAEVAASLTLERIAAVIETTARELDRFFGVSRPRIAVCGLNPHAGEGGAMGFEELQIIDPAIAVARQRLDGVVINGPFPADTLFSAWAGSADPPYDAVVCMYHDQGLIPLKLLDFGGSINLTLGLPIIRTSPDHGTAYDIAGKGCADATSMSVAIEAARAAVKRKSQNP